VIGSSLSPVLIQQNTIQGIQGNGITLLSITSIDMYVDVLSNSISLGNATAGPIGMVTVPFSSGKLATNIASNVIQGNNGGFVGIVVTNQGPSCQEATIQDNTVSNIHATTSPIPILGVGGGIGAAVIGSGNLNVTISNNSLSGNTPQGIFGIDSNALGGSGTLCMTFENNKGIGLRPADNYTLFNPTSAPASTFIYNDAGGNVGTFTFNPSASDFTAGTCTSCP
jgi:hypothetical protein